jgi:hypothetical protein
MYVVSNANGIICGCSFSFGLAGIGDSFKKIKSYSEFLSEKLDFTHQNISLVGGSNYSIAKQIEWAVLQNPGFIVFNTTTTNRHEYVRDFNQLSDITINDFNYIINESPTVFPTSNQIRSLSIRRIIEKSTGNNDYKKILDYHVNYTCDSIKKDYDRMYILYAISLIAKKNIPYICIDLAGLMNLETSDNIINIHYTDMTRNYPLKDDPMHFNEDGHLYISDQILSRLHTSL